MVKSINHHLSLVRSHTQTLVSIDRGPCGDMATIGPEHGQPTLAPAVSREFATRHGLRDFLARNTAREWCVEVLHQRAACADESLAVASWDRPSGKSCTVLRHSPLTCSSLCRCVPRYRVSHAAEGERTPTMEEIGA